MSVDWGLRAVRSAMFAAVCTLLGTAAHLSMSGQSVPWWALAIAGEATFGLAWLLSAKQRGVVQVVGLTIGAQAGLHVWFAVGQALTAAPVAAGTTMPDMPGMPGMAMDGAAGMSTNPGFLSSDSWGMLTAHLAAAAVVGLWLAAGERAVFRLLASAAAFVLTPLALLFRPVVPVPQPRRGPVTAQSAKPLCQLLLVHVIVSRGPPAGVAVL